LFYAYNAFAVFSIERTLGSGRLYASTQPNNQMKTTNKSPFKYTLNGVEGNSPEVLSQAVAELLALYQKVYDRKTRRKANELIWAGRAAYVINHLYGNKVSMNTNAHILSLWLNKALTDGKVQPFTGTL